MLRPDLGLGSLKNRLFRALGEKPDWRRLRRGEVRKQIEESREVGRFDVGTMKGVSLGGVSFLSRA